MIHLRRSRHTPSPAVATQGPIPAVTTIQSLRINISSIYGCGLQSKLLLRDFIGFVMNYDVVCMCETRCDNGNTNSIGRSDGKLWI